MSPEENMMSVNRLDMVKDLDQLGHDHWMALANKHGGLANVLAILRGTASVTLTIIRHLIDCDADPIIPDGWSVEEHQKGGQFEWDPTKVSLWLSPNQQNGKYIKGTELRKKLRNVPVMNANLLDWYLANPQLIPEEWKGKAVFFWGTIYRDSGGDSCVRYLYWNDDRWRWDSYWLEDVWNGYYPALVRAST